MFCRAFVRSLEFSSTLDRRMRFVLVNFKETVVLVNLYKSFLKVDFYSQ